MAHAKMRPGMMLSPVWPVAVALGFDGALSFAPGCG
jgi:hypothetical protein